MVVVYRLIWDPANIAHIARHAVDAEEACHGAHVLYWAYDGRIMIIGRTRAGKMLAVVLESREEGTYYAVTARPASRIERRIFESAKGGGDAE